MSVTTLFKLNGTMSAFLSKLVITLLLRHLRPPNSPLPFAPQPPPPLRLKRFKRSVLLKQDVKRKSYRNLILPEPLNLKGVGEPVAETETLYDKCGVPCESQLVLGI